MRSGGSLLLWSDYFPSSIVAGIDVDPPTVELPADRVRFYRGRQEDVALLARVGREVWSGSSSAGGPHTRTPPPPGGSGGVDG